MIGHLSGPRITALLDGRLAKRESDEAWAHVYSCHPCRDLVEREGWIKSRLAGLGAHSEDDAPSAPVDDAPPALADDAPPALAAAAPPAASRSTRHTAAA